MSGLILLHAVLFIQMVCNYKIADNSTYVLMQLDSSPTVVHVFHFN